MDADAKDPRQDYQTTLAHVVGHCRKVSEAVRRDPSLVFLNLNDQEFDRLKAVVSDPRPSIEEARACVVLMVHSVGQAFNETQGLWRIADVERLPGDMRRRAVREMRNTNAAAMGALKTLVMGKRKGVRERAA